MTLRGRIPFFMRRTLGLVSRSRFTWGEAVRLRFWEPTWMLTDPADIRHVLTARAANYRKTPHLASEEGRRRAGRGLITLSGSAHHDRRRLLHPAFRQEAVARYEAVILRRTGRMMEAWRPGDVVDVAERMAILAQENIVGTLFGDAFQDEEGRIARAILARRAYTEYHYHSRLPFHTRLPLPVVRRHRDAVRLLDETIHAAIAERRRRTSPPDDLTAALLQAATPDGVALEDGEVRDEVFPLTVTGYETVGEALAWTWHLLSCHPDVERRLADELREVLGDRDPTASDLPALVHTERVVAESMRLYPPTWVYVRVPVEADTLPSGAAVPAGARLYLSPYLLHRDPRAFSDPDRFDPDRFADPQRRRDWKYTYFPFGVGAHRCIGEHLAKLEILLVVASVARRFRLEAVRPGRDVRPAAGITLRPRGGVPLRVLPR